jgi:hypothetical protein
MSTDEKAQTLVDAGIVYASGELTPAYRKAR